MKRLFLIGIVLSMTQYAIGQKFEKNNFGILLSSDFNYLKPTYSDWKEAGIQDELNAVTTQQKLGFTCGLLYKFNLTERLSLIPQTLLSIQESNLNFDVENEENHREVIALAAISFPIHLVWTKHNNKKVNPSITIGGRFIQDITNRKEPPANSAFLYTDYKLAVKKFDMTIDLGTGLEIPLKKMTIKPELLYSFGLVNLKDSGEGIYNSAISSLNSDKISFRLLFYR